MVNFIAAFSACDVQVTNEMCKITTEGDVIGFDAAISACEKEGDECKQFFCLLVKLAWQPCPLARRAVSWNSPQDAGSWHDCQCDQPQRSMRERSGGIWRCFIKVAKLA